jgi:hypothetical protein
MPVDKYNQGFRMMYSAAGDETSLCPAVKTGNRAPLSKPCTNALKDVLGAVASFQSPTHVWANSAVDIQCCEEKN